MDGTARHNPARVVLSAGAVVLAGMACRVGWIDLTAVGSAVLVTLLVVTAMFIFLAVMIAPVLIVSALIFAGCKAFGLFWPAPPPKTLSPWNKLP